MFRRIVSNLPFSPALVGQLSFYARRLRKEELTRRLGLVFTALALVVQGLAVLQPPEAINAATPGQVDSAPRCTVTAVGDRGSAFTITGHTASVTFNVDGGANCKVKLSVNTFYAPTMDGRPYSQQILYERVTKIYDKPGKYTLSASLPAKSDKSKGCFYQVDLTYGTHNVLPVLAYGHGTLDCSTTPPPPPPPVMCQYKPTLPANHPDCKPCPGNSNLWIKDENCRGDITLKKTANNLTQGNVSASTVVANAGDKISFTLTATNKGIAPSKVTISDNLSDVLEYAQIIDTGGGTLDSTGKTIEWAATTLAPQQSTSRVIAVQVMSTIPMTAQSTAQPQSYDCKMVNTFGTTIAMAIKCPVEKQVVQQVTTELPHTGPRENMLFAAALASVVVYFWARSRQLGKEVRLIRRDVHAGAI